MCTLHVLDTFIIADKLEKDIRHNTILSNIAAITSFTIFILNVSCCIWFAFSCHNAITNNRCNEQTWGKFYIPILRVDV